MSKVWDYLKQGLKIGAVAGAAIGAAAVGVSVVMALAAGASLVAPLVLLGITAQAMLSGAIGWGIIGGIVGGTIGLFSKNDTPPSVVTAAKVGRNANPSLEPELSQQQEQASTRFRDQEADRRQATAAPTR